MSAGGGTPATRIRVISDNDYAGDPDGLVQLAHQALSPSAELVAVLASHLPLNDDWAPNRDTADQAAAEARVLLDLAGASQVPVHVGSNLPLTSPDDPIETPAVRAIIDVALAEDPRPLYGCFGGGLTELASAWLIEPAIAERLTVIWIGGAEYPGLAVPPPGGSAAEFNTIIDPIAAQVVFNDSNLKLWQVPRDAYRQVIASMADLAVNLQSAGPLGRHLYQRLTGSTDFVRSLGQHPGETFVLGDSPLVSLSTLQTTFEPDPASSAWVERIAPVIAADGSYAEADGRGRTVRVFTRIDTELILRDFYAKLRQLARSAEGTELE